MQLVPYQGLKLCRDLCAPQFFGAFCSLHICWYTSLYVRKKKSRNNFAEHMRCHHMKFNNLSSQIQGFVHPCFQWVEQGSVLSSEFLNVLMGKIIRRVS